MRKESSFDIMFKALTTKKENKKSEFNNVEVIGDLIHSEGKCYIHPVSNIVPVSGELGRVIIMHEVIPETVELVSTQIERFKRFKPN